MTERFSKNSNVATYHGIDFVKFMMALCVVMIHVKSFFVSFDPGKVVDFIISMAVPFFFIVSGFLLANKLAKTEDISNIKKYSKRIWRMYFIWIAIYIPLCLWGEYFSPSESSFMKFVFVQLRSVVMLGDIRFSYPTWYLYSLGIASTLVYLFRKFRINLLFLFGVGLIGILLQYLAPILDVSSTVSNLMSSLSRMSIGSAYVIIGMYIYDHRNMVNKVASTFLICIAILLFYLKLPFFETIGSMSLFFFSLICTNLISGQRSLWFRKQSLWIYLTHMYVLTPLCLLESSLNPWIIYGLCVVVCIVVSQILITAGKRKAGNFLNRLV